MPNKPLTKRQFQIWKALARGQSNKEIAVQFGLSVNTVAIHIRDLYKRLRVRNRTQAALAFVFVERLP